MKKTRGAVSLNPAAPFGPGRSRGVAWPLRALAAALAALCPVLCAPGGAAAESLKPEIEYEYYEVNVKDDAGIVEEAFRATPIRRGGAKYLGQADCATGYTYTPDQQGDRCGVADYELTLKCVVTLPRFNGVGEAARPGVEAFMERLIAHEHRHCRIFAEYAEKFRDWVESGPSAGCNSLVNVIRTAFNRNRNECNNAQDQYDRETLHGRTEGADLQWHLASEADRLLMAEGATAPAVRVTPEITYDYYDVPVKTDGVGSWRTTTAGLEWSSNLTYKPRRNIDETCRVMRYELQVGCRVKLPRFTGGDQALQPELAAQVEKLKKIQLDRCGLAAAEADKFVADISGDRTFHCDRMANNITARHNQLMKDGQEAIQGYDQGREAAAASPLAAKPVEPKIEYQYYEVPLNDAGQALAQAAQKTRLGRGGPKALSGSKVKMGYSYMPRQLPDGACRVLDYEVKLDCEITLPRFKSDDQEVLKKVEPLFEKLKDAELKRCGLAVDRANRLGEWLRSDRTFQCGPMGNHIRGRFNQVFKEIQEAMENYDGDEI